MFIIKHNAKIYIYTSRCLSATVYTSWDILTCQDLPLPSGSTALGYDFTAQVKSVPGLSLLYTRTCIPHYCFSRIAIRYFTFKHKHLEIHFIGCLDAVRSTCGFIRISADKNSWETVTACTMRVISYVGTVHLSHQSRTLTRDGPRHIRTPCAKRCKY